METLGFFAFVMMGVVLGMIGSGGSILTVPILVGMFHFSAVEATTDSLFIVGGAASVGAWLSYHRGEVSIPTFLKFSIPSFVGVALMKGSVVPWMPEVFFPESPFPIEKSQVLLFTFASLMLMSGFSMLRKKSQQERAAKFPTSSTHLIGPGFLVGSVTGFVGAGGGFLIVPALTQIVGLPIRNAIATSFLIIAANSLFGFAVAATQGHPLHWNHLLITLGCALVGLFLGQRISHQISDEKMKKGFGIFVIVMSAWVFSRVFGVH